jgi:hypothetical protein
MPNLLDIAKIKAAGGLAELLDEAARPVPEITGQYIGADGQLKTSPIIADARTIAGTQYKTLIRTALPTAGFRDVNAGSASSSSTLETRLVEAFLLNPRWECDKAIADACEDGATAYIASEAAAILTASLMTLGKQFYYGRGTGGDAKGHPGLITSHDATNMVVDAGGTTASTGSSLWAVKFGPMDVQWVLGGNGDLNVSDVRIESVVDPADSTKRFTAYVQELMSWVGLQVRSQNSVGRIKKLTADSGKGLTDARIGSLLALFPTGWRPDVMFCSRRSLEQLRASRTATNATGAEAPTPTTFEGIPIIPTDSILNTESLTL